MVQGFWPRVSGSGTRVRIISEGAGAEQTTAPLPVIFFCCCPAQLVQTQCNTPERAAVHCIWSRKPGGATAKKTITWVAIFWLHARPGCSLTHSNNHLLTYGCGLASRQSLFSSSTGRWEAGAKRCTKNCPACIKKTLIQP